MTWGLPQGQSLLAVAASHSGGTTAGPRGWDILTWARILSMFFIKKETGPPERPAAHQGHNTGRTPHWLHRRSLAGSGRYPGRTAGSSHRPYRRKRKHNLYKWPFEGPHLQQRGILSKKPGQKTMAKSQKIKKTTTTGWTVNLRERFSGAQFLFCFFVSKV